MTLGELQTYRAALVTALSRGEKSVTYQGRSVTMRDVGEIRDALTIIDSEIASMQTAPSSPFTVVSTDMD